MVSLSWAFTIGAAAALPAQNSLRIEYHDSKTAASVARSLVYTESLADVSTVYSNDLDPRNGTPVSFTEYYADCDGDGHPYLLLVDISTTGRNVKDGSPLSLGVRASAKGVSYPGQVPGSVAGSPRLSLRGKLRDVDDADKIESCFAEKHPDSKYWFPGNNIHESSWQKFEVDGIYFIGGFGDRAYIGEIPAAEYNSAKLLGEFFQQN